MGADMGDAAFGLRRETELFPSAHLHYLALLSTCLGSNNPRVAVPMLRRLPRKSVLAGVSW